MLIVKVTFTEILRVLVLILIIILLWLSLSRLIRDGNVNRLEIAVTRFSG